MSIVGKPAPHFEGKAAKDGEIVRVSLDDYKGRWLILFFYPADFTFVCPTEIVAFSEQYRQFQQIGADVLGASTDSVNCHLAYMRTPRDEGGIGELNYPLLADSSKEIARAYDVLDGDEALRGVFVIDPKGIVQSATINSDAVGRNIDEVLRTLKAFQYVAEHGGVCPANWHEGEAGMEKSLAGVAKTIGH
jgi:peroxiredoxin (alkyl hydroperoxide reductase subunit C)